MSGARVLIGILPLVAAFTALGLKCLLANKRGRWPGWGWAGVAIILITVFLFLWGNRWVAVFFTPLVWTGYLLLVDALVWKLRGESRLGTSPAHFFSLVFWSVPLWLVFEAYNLRLENWRYVGLPSSVVLSVVGYVWSFATIWPAIYETSDLIAVLGFWGAPSRRAVVLRPAGHLTIFVLGLFFVTVPALVPAQLGGYLFGAVWLGFVLLIDPINYRWGGRSLLRDLERGHTASLYSFLLAGLVCGLLWEFWNFWAGARWVYVFPLGQKVKIFEMPLPGYLGFPPFALECFVMYEFLVTLRRRLPRLRGRQEMQMAGSQP